MHSGKYFFFEKPAKGMEQREAATGLSEVKRSEGSG